HYFCTIQLVFNTEGLGKKKFKYRNHLQTTRVLKLRCLRKRIWKSIENTKNTTIMKKLLAITFMVFGTVFGAFATGNNVTVVAEKRANHLSEQMIRELRLNNYQANKVREINLDVAAQITEIEQKHAGNEQLIAEKCKDVLAVRDLEFEDILSTVQYNDYFGDRKMYS